jgi:hypothetical protein
MDSNPDVDFERSDADPKLIGWISVGIASFVVLVPLLIPLFFPETLVRKTAQPPDISDAAPRLAVHPRNDLGRFKSAENNTLHNYAWVDRPHGTVRIPIEHAMDMLAKQGPQWPKPAQ